MANVKISQLPSLTSLSGTDVLPVVSGNVTYNVTAANIAALASGANTGNVTFDNNIILGTGDEFGGDGLYLAPGPGSVANSAVQFLRVRGGDYPTHIHLDTGNNEFYDQYFGADNRYVKLEANGNIVINANDYTGNEGTWNFDVEGNLTVPGNIAAITTGFPFSSNISGINTGSPTVLVTLTDASFMTASTGSVTITGVVGTVEANNTWYYQSIDPSNFQLYYDQALTNAVDGTTWTTYVSGGLAVALGYSNITITSGNLSVVTNNNSTWQFGSNSNFYVPQGGYIGAAGIKGGGTMLTGGAGNLASLTSYYADAVDIYSSCATANPDGTLDITTYGNGTGIAGQWTFGGANLTIPGTITAPNEETINIQALDNDGVVSSILRLEPNNTLTELLGYSSQQSRSWTTADWATGVYTTQGGGTIGAVEFTGATAIIDFVNSLPNPEHVFIQVNNGPLLPFAGSSGGATNITFYTNDLPATDPTTVTDFAYYYSVYSGIGIDYDSDIFEIYANDADLELFTRGPSDISINSARDIGLTANGSFDLRNDSATASINIVTDNNGLGQTWNYGNTGVLTLPGEGIIRSVDDTVTLLSFNTTTGNANSVYLGTSGGLGFSDQEIGGNWLEIFRNGAEPEIRVPVGRGNLNIQTAEGGNAYNWTLDNTGNLTLPGNTFAVNYANGTQVTNLYGNTTTIAIGQDAGNAGQSGNAIALGTLAGAIFQGVDTIAIGQQAGNNNQNANSIAIGAFAGTGFQAGNAVAVGTSAGSFNQGISATSVGGYAGTFNQANGAVALGGSAGFSNQGVNAVAIGLQAGNAFQGNSSIAIGTGAATANQGLQSIALGVGAGDNAQGNNAIAIGAFAGNATQPANSIMLNASGTALNGTNAGFYVKPVRNDNTNVANAVYYNPSTNEVTYSAPQLWFKGGLSAAQSLTTSTDTTILWNSNTDTQGWGSDASVSGRIVPNKSGWYEVISRVEFSAVAGNTSAQVNHQIAVNGVQQAISQTPNSATLGSGVSVIATAMVNLNGNTDYITASCYTTITGQECAGTNASMILVKWIST